MTPGNTVESNGGILSNIRTYIDKNAALSHSKVGALFDANYGKQRTAYAATVSPERIQTLAQRSI